jgi:hypothetical protein
VPALAALLVVLVIDRVGCAATTTIITVDTPIVLSQQGIVKELLDTWLLFPFQLFARPIQKDAAAEPLHTRQ